MVMVVFLVMVLLVPRVPSPDPVYSRMDPVLVPAQQPHVQQSCQAAHLANPSLQGSVENILAESFNSLCQELRDGLATCPSSYTRLRSDSFSSGLSSSSR